LRAVIMISIGLRDNAELILQTRNLGQITYLTDGEIKMTGDMLIGDMPLARAWDYWVARAGFAGM
jgi:hypothetical protein